VRFAYNDRFDPSEFNIKFDYIISHSILSHAAYWQLPLFIENVSRSIKKGTKILASLHFTEGNIYGDRGYSGTELDFKEWIYPYVSYFRKETIENVAKQYGYKLTINDFVPAMLITRAHPAANHSWVILEKQ